MKLTWQYKRNDYTVDINKQPLFGDLKLGDIINVKTLDGQQFELCIIYIEDNVYECEVLQCIKS